MLRIGHGYDAHRLVADRKLILGGVIIPHKKGLLGHSDADALCHAVCDALLGALALGDIGKHFPSGDSRYKDASSLELLKSVYGKVKENGYALGNLDCTIVCQTPALSPYIDDMRKNIAAVLGAAFSSVSVKATTEERMGFTGREEGISAHAVCILYRSSNDGEAVSPP
jgi:2-C-methyl-D-erythritol 2,4-cyclodiphosphate synthase